MTISDTPTPNADAVRQRQMALEQHIKSSPTDRGSYLELAAIYRHSSLLPRAMQILKQAQELFPGDEEILWELEETQLSRSLQQLTEARNLVAKISNPEADQTLERSVVDWANCRIRVCRSRLQRDPSKLYLRLVLGEALYDQNEYDAAIEELEPALQSETHGPAANLWTGRCHAISGRDAPAMKHLRAAALGRLVVGPTKVRTAALRLLVDLADRHGLNATLAIYRNALDKCLSEESSPASTPAASP